MTKVFIDGSAGTTGLRIYERLEKRDDIELLRLSEENRKDKSARAEALNSADIAFLCLPDDAARESVSLCTDKNTVIIDTSTAHRTLDDWAYGFPELSDKFESKIAKSNRIAVPGCHASGFIALVYPLIEAGLLKKESRLSCFSITGYSGGGKKMIEQYEQPERDIFLNSPRQYGISQMHKHLPEMKAVTGISDNPVFIPVVADFYSGMEVTVPIFASELKNGAAVSDIIGVYKDKYAGPIVNFRDFPFEDGFAAANKFTGKDCMEISIGGNDERILLIARYDNLGKGASGAAVECMNISLGIDKTTGLEL